MMQCKSAWTLSAGTSRLIYCSTAAPHISGMIEPELSEEETRTLIDYARQKFAEEC